MLVADFSLAILNAPLHCFAVYLVILAKDPKQCSHEMYVLNMLCVELVVSLLNMSRLIVKCALPDTSTRTEMLHYHFFVNNTFMKTVSFINLVYLIVNKVMAARMGANYHIWNINWTRILILISWISGTIVFIFIATKFPTKHEFMIHNVQYFHFPANIFCLTIALCCHIYIFYKVKKSILPPSCIARTHRKVSSFWTVFRKSQFFTTFLYTLSYVALGITPNMLKMVSLLANGKLRHSHANTFFLMMMICNSLICIFFETRIQRLVIKMINNRIELRDIERELYRRRQIHIAMRRRGIVTANRRVQTTSF